MFTKRTNLDRNIVFLFADLYSKNYNSYFVLVLSKKVHERFFLYSKKKLYDSSMTFINLLSNKSSLGGKNKLKHRTKRLRKMNIIIFYQFSRTLFKQYSGNQCLVKKIFETNTILAAFSHEHSSEVIIFEILNPECLAMKMAHTRIIFSVKLLLVKEPYKSEAKNLGIVFFVVLYIR